MKLPCRASTMQAARRRFYKLGGTWYRCRAFERLGSQRYSRPALFELDEKLVRLMPRSGGVFVEAGAHDGYTQSNTYYLERYRGWSGVLIEPIPELRARCERRRPHSRVIGCALVGAGFAADTAEMRFGDLMSVIGPHGTHAAGGLAVAGRSGYTVRVPARTLSDVLAEAGVSEIDLLVLDVEGHELDVLSGLDFERHCPGHLLIEALDRTAQKPAIDRALDARYDFAEMLSEYDLLYRRRQPHPS